MKNFLITMIIAVGITISTPLYATWYNPMTWYGETEVVEVVEVEEVVIIRDAGTVVFDGQEGLNNFPVQLICDRSSIEQDYLCNKTVVVNVNGYTVIVQVRDKIKQVYMPTDMDYETYEPCLSKK